IVKSQALQAALPRSLDPGRIWLLPSGIDLARFRPLDRGACRVKLGWDTARRHVVFPAAPERAEKRFWLAEAAVAELKRTDVELHALDGVSHEDVPTWLNAADVVLLTSTHEGSPNVVKEALACNVPVVSVDVGDVAGRDGSFVAAADPAELAARLATILAGPARCRSRH